MVRIIRQQNTNAEKQAESIACCDLRTAM